MALKPVVEGMGMSWGSQHTKLSAEPNRFSYTVIGTTGADGKRYEMAAIPLRRYPMWLATINPAVRQRVEVRAGVGGRADHLGHGRVGDLVAPLGWRQSSSAPAR